MEFATRNYPFKELRDDTIFLMLQNDKAEIPLKLSPKTSHLLASLISKCMKRDAKERPNFTDLKSTLDNFCSEDFDLTLENSDSVLDEIKKNGIDGGTMAEKIRTLEKRLKHLGRTQEPLDRGNLTFQFVIPSFCLVKST